MATNKTLTPTNVVIQIPDFTDRPDQRVTNNCIDKEADAINELNNNLSGLKFATLEQSTAGKTAGTAFEIDLPSGFTSANRRLITSCYLLTQNNNLYSESAYDTNSSTFRIVATSAGKLNITPYGSSSTAGTLKITLARV